MCTHATSRFEIGLVNTISPHGSWYNISNCLQWNCLACGRTPDAPNDTSYLECYAMLQCTVLSSAVHSVGASRPLNCTAPWAMRVVYHRDKHMRLEDWIASPESEDGV